MQLQFKNHSGHWIFRTKGCQWNSIGVFEMCLRRGSHKGRSILHRMPKNSKCHRHRVPVSFGLYFTGKRGWWKFAKQSTVCEMCIWILTLKKSRQVPTLSVQPYFERLQSILWMHPHWGYVPTPKLQVWWFTIQSFPIRQLCKVLQRQKSGICFLQNPFRGSCIYV